MLCLGAQNLNERRVLNLGIGKTGPLPTGFIVSVSTVLGVLAGGSVAAILLPQQRDWATASPKRDFSYSQKNDNRPLTA